LADLCKTTRRTAAIGRGQFRLVEPSGIAADHRPSVPVFWVSCGTMTTAPTNPGYAGSGNIFLESSNSTLDNGIYANSSSLTGGSIMNTTSFENGTYSTYVSEKRGIHRPGRFNMPRRRSEADACDNSKGSTTTNYCNTTVCTIEDVWLDMLMCL
jgi:hypothetical protein